MYLYQNTSEPDHQLLPGRAVCDRASTCERDVNVFVLNNTYIVNPTTVATFRVGMNTFSDDNGLPYAFDMRTVPGINANFANSLLVQKFPDLTLSGGFPSTGNTGLNDTQLLLVGRAMAR